MLPHIQARSSTEISGGSMGRLTDKVARGSPLPRTLSAFSVYQNIWLILHYLKILILLCDNSDKKLGYRRDSARRRSLRRSRSFKVTDVSTNRKLLCNYLLINNTRLSVASLGERGGPPRVTPSRGWHQSKIKKKWQWWAKKVASFFWENK